MNSPRSLHPADQVLLGYGLGKLDDTSAITVYSHLEGCPDCRRRVAEMSSDSFIDRRRNAKVSPASQRSAATGADGLSILDRGGIVAPPPSADTLPPGLAGQPDYEILRELGRGGMGVVYLAQNRLMGRLEVLKVVSGHLVSRPAVLERFLREIRSAARLQHPNIVTAYSATRIGESYVLAMEYVDGLDLSCMVKAKGPLPIVHACNFAYQAALGLQHAHERGMVHRDIKPANLILSRLGKKAVVKVLDFGLAKISSEGQRDSGLTRAGQMLGTPDYIAPEQIRDAQSADIRADIYSLGCTLYCLLSGGPPFTGDTLWDVYQAHFSMAATPLNLARPDVPTELAALVAKMMAKEPGGRFQQPGEVAQALLPFLKVDDRDSPAQKPKDTVSDVYILAEIPPALPPALDQARPAARSGSESRLPGTGGRGHLRSPALAIAALAAAVLLSATLAGSIWLASRQDRPRAQQAARAAEPRPFATPVSVPRINEIGPAHGPAENDPESLVRDAMTAIRGGNLNRARMLLNQYLSRSQTGKQVDAARVLLGDIDLATSSAEAEALARRLSDQEIGRHLEAGARALVNISVKTPELRHVYARTLLEAFGQESRRRGSVKVEMPVAKGPPPASKAAHTVGANDQADSDRLPVTLLAPDDDDETAPARVADHKDATTLEMIFRSPAAFEGRTITLDGMYKLGTLLARPKGSGGNSIGWCLAVGRGDDRLICKEDGKVIGSNCYLMLDSRLAPVLKRAYDEFKFHPEAKPRHKCTLTVTVRPVAANGTRVPVATIVGVELLGTCNFLQVAQRRYERAFVTVRVTPEKAWAVYGDGALWVERLGGEEKFVKPLRRKLRDLQRKAIADRGHQIIGSILQAQLGRAVNMAAASEAQLRRYGAALTGGVR